MFDYSSMLKRAIEYFPLWSDIRKRTKKSIGGQLIDSALKETLELESAINEYKDYYFLNKYDGKEDQVLAYAYAATVGNLEDVNNIEVIYNEEYYVLTLDINEFYNNDKLSYYENGVIYIKELIDNNTKLKVNIDDYSYTYTLTKTHVWNIFDEYACFVGIQRYENETNKQLKDRILFTTKNLGSSSEDGLKNAIVSELMSLIDIDKDDIEISKVTPANLIKPYKEYTSLLEMLDAINKDCLKDKRWDLDKWEYDFKSISFLDNIWDDVVSKYQNGIGSNDDLKVIIADNDMTTDAEIIMYDKSLVKLEKYVADKHIKKDIKFKLKRYENVLNPVNAKYAIKGSEAIEITNDEIELSVYESNNKKESRQIQDLYKLGKDITVIDNSKITDNKSYRLEFYSNGNQDTMKVSKAKVIYKHKITGETLEVKDLLKPAPGFTINAQGDLVNTSIKKTVRSINHFNSFEGLMDSSNGIILKDNMNTGKGIIDVTGLGLNIVNINIDHQTVEMPKSLIKYNKYAFWKEDELIFRYDIDQERRFEIDTKANIIQFDIVEGQADLFVEIDGNTNYQKIKAPYTWSTKKSNLSKDIRIIVVSNHNDTVKFANFKYACHDVEFKLQYGNLIQDSTGQYRLPSIPVNSLIVDITSKTSSSPIINSILIGGDMTQLRYRTEIIENKSNANRIIEISTNGLVDLLTVDAVGNVIYRNEKYTPATSYKATKDDAWIRLNLDEYETINDVTCDIGSIQLIEESGKIYYNIVLKSGQSVSCVTINGLRNTAIKTITLEKMIQFYFPEFDSTMDKVYANKLCKGLIVEDNDLDNPRVLIINIKSEMFKGIDASKYKFTKLPTTLTTAFNSSSSQINDIETSTAFESISFIPASTKIYQAVNEANIYTEEVRGIKILNNFSPILNTSSLMYYEVNAYDSAYNFEVKFAASTETNKSFDTLNNWCLGNKDIAIKTNINLSNSENYDITEIEISDEVLLSRYVDIKKTYTLSNNNEIFTNKFMVIPEDDCEVLYERYSDNQNPELIVQEEVIMESDGFTKLNYSNVDDLLYIGYSTYDGKNEILISEFKLLKEEGIILWTDKTLIDQAKKVHLRYTIKNPVSILLSEDSLYKAIGYNIEAYEEINRFKLAGITDGYRFDLRQLDDYNLVDMIYTKCESNSFKAEGVNDVLIFNKVANTDTILVKTGYYYINGREYYLFPSKDEIDVYNKQIIDMSNVDISGDEITTFKATNNYVRNSEMLYRGINELYNYDASKEPIKGVSTLNSITACDNFNHWKTFGTKMFLKDGLNGVGINFESYIPNGYAYIDITENLTKNVINYISLWAEKELSVFIGEETKYLNMNFPHSINIKLQNEIVYNNDEIRAAVLTPKADTKYYLIAKNSGTIDDILISTESNLAASHTKNIDLLNLKIVEASKSGQKHRVFIKDNTDVINNGASLNRNGVIQTSSNIYWGISPFKIYESKEDFAECSTYNVNIENDYIYTDKADGYIETAPIYLNNPLAIKRLVLKINEIGFDNMRGMKMQILSSNTRNGDFVPINSFNDNYGFVYGDALLKYIKLKIVIPESKYINNFGIYIEYCSTEDNYPKLFTPTSGEIITKIYDTQYSNDYKIRDISIDSISNINDVEIYVQSSKDDYSADVWQSWKRIELDSNLKIKNELKFNSTRFFRFKVLLKTSNASIKINNIDIEVI